MRDIVSVAFAAAITFGAADAAVAAEVAPALAAPKTVCTITVNSPDERDVFQRYLPADDYRFVELVERGRPDWLGSACRTGVQCDVLVISGHFDAGTEFYSDRLDQRESLPVEEMERVACSERCGGLFSQLKEVYLFGCNTLNGDLAESTAEEIARTLRRSGHAPDDAAHLARILDRSYGESNRDTMRRIFSNVPVIYGFSSLAPLGRVAGPLLGKVLETTPAGEVGSGMASSTLLKAFGPSSMIAVTGLADFETRALARPRFCEFVNDQGTVANHVDTVHHLIARDPAEARMLLDRVEKVTKALAADVRALSSVDAALSRAASDREAGERWLGYARKTDRPEIRARLINVGAALGWLTPAEQRAELVRAFAAQIELDAVTVADVDLACALNSDGSLDGGSPMGEFPITLPAARLARASNAGVLACLGSGAARLQVLKALTSADADDVHIAQVYLKHRPLNGEAELRAVTRSITRMPSADAQVRALDALAQHHLSDPDALNQLTRLFSSARSLAVQRAIAGVLIRADSESLPRDDLARLLRQHRLRSPDGVDLIDVLIRRLSA